MSAIDDRLIVDLAAASEPLPTWAASVWTRSVLLGAGPFRAAVRPVIAFPCALFLAAVFAIMLATGGQV